MKVTIEAEDIPTELRRAQKTINDLLAEHDRRERQARVERAPPEQRKWLRAPVSELGLSPRLVNALRSAGIWSVSQLVDVTLEQVRALHGVGRRSADELVRAMERVGLRLASPYPEWSS